MEIPAHVISMIGHALLFMLALGMSATVDINSLVTQVRNTNAIYTGVVMQFIVLPFLGFLSVKMFHLDNVAGLMLLIVTSSPGGSFSNWWCSVFNADLALSITMTSINTVISMIMLPLNLYMYTSLAFGDYDGFDVRMIDFKELAFSLIVVISAVTIGVVASTMKKSHNFNVHANYLGTFAGFSLALLGATIAIASKNEVKLWEQGWQFFVAVMIPPTAGLLLSNAVTSCRGLKKPECVTVSIETSVQNCAIAVSIGLTMFQGNNLAKAMTVPFYYGVFTFLVIGTYCIIAWKAGWTKAPPSEKFWKVIRYSYEVATAEQIEKYGVEVQLQDAKEPLSACGLGTCIKYCHEPDISSLEGNEKEDEKNEKMLANNQAQKKESNQHVEVALDWLKKLGYQIKESETSIV